MPARIRKYLFLISLLFTYKTWAQSSPVDLIVTDSSLQKIVLILAADSFMGRFTGSQQAIEAAHYIANEFKNAGAFPIAGNDGYFIPFYKNGPAVNVVAALPGGSKAKEIVLFSAHYDHIGTVSSAMPWRQPENGHPNKGDTIFNGANDNASGVAALIHLVRFYAKMQHRERTVIFIAFSGEELGLVGSQLMSSSFDPKTVQAMVNMDMLGRSVSEKTKEPFVTGAQFSDLRRVMNKRLFGLAPEYGDNYFRMDKYDLFNRSDNYHFAMKGIAAHSIIACPPNDKYYHSLNDEPETLDYSFFATVVKAIALGCSGLVEGTDEVTQ